VGTTGGHKRDSRSGNPPTLPCCSFSTKLTNEPMPRPQLSSKLRDKIAEVENSIRNFEYARERMLTRREAAEPSERNPLDRALALNAQSLDGLNRELTAVKDMLGRTLER
jgi:hypothetical protein